MSNRLTVTSIALFTVAALSAGAEKEPHFAPGAASSYPTHQTTEKVTIAAVPYVTEDQVRLAFGKVDPNKHCILPLLIIVQNDSPQTLRLDSMRVEYVTFDGRHIEATPARDVPYLAGAREPKMTPAAKARSASRGFDRRRETARREASLSRIAMSLSAPSASCKSFSADTIAWQRSAAPDPENTSAKNSTA